MTNEPLWWGVLIMGGYTCVNFPGGSEGKTSVYNVGDLGSTTGLGRSPHGEEPGRLQSMGLQRVKHD